MQQSALYLEQCLSLPVFFPDGGSVSPLQSMLGLPFQITPMMLIGIILGGGALMLALEWLLTVKSIERAYAYFVSLTQPLIA